jgi:hypothetical protein
LVNRGKTLAEKPSVGSVPLCNGFQ